ncbi:MAG: HK97 family phage prohead protease [Pseudomonadota bacterium]
MDQRTALGLEVKYCASSAEVGEGAKIAGYASLFGQRDRGGDVVAAGAYSTSLKRLKAQGRRVKMLWQHDPNTPLGVWDVVREDAKGLWVEGRLLPQVQASREALALLEAGAVDGLSIGYRTVKAEAQAQGRLLTEIELWEVSLVTFPMQPDARAHAGADGQADALAGELAEAFAEARARL